MPNRVVVDLDKLRMNPDCHPECSYPYQKDAYYEGTLPQYSEQMCPRSMDLFDRAVHVSINKLWSERDCLNVARAINKVCAVYG